MADDVLDRVGDPADLVARDAAGGRFAGDVARAKASVLAPRDDLGLAPELRRSVAARVGRGVGAAFADPALAALASGGMPAELPLAAVARHVDLITSEPRCSDAAALQALADAGLSTPQIVALSELIGFLAFEIRLTQGLDLVGVP